MSHVAVSLLEAVYQAGGRVTLDGDTLHLSAPRPLSEILMASLRQFKPEIIRYLSETPRALVVLGSDDRRLAEPKHLPAPKPKTIDGSAKEILGIINAQIEVGRIERRIRHTMDQNIDRLRLNCARQFGHSRGWNLGNAAFSPKALAVGRAGGYRYNDLDQWRFVDHNYWYYQNRHPAGLATHPYDVNDRYRAEAAAWAEQRGLTVEFPTDFTSWWYPGRTTLVVFRAT